VEEEHLSEVAGKDNKKPGASDSGFLLYTTCADSKHFDEERRDTPSLSNGGQWCLPLQTQCWSQHVQAGVFTSLLERCGFTF